VLPAPSVAHCVPLPLPTNVPALHVAHTVVGATGATFGHTCSTACAAPLITGARLAVGMKR
jgi:hypothetical protein